MLAFRRHPVLGSIPLLVVIAALLSKVVVIPASAAKQPAASGWKIEFDGSDSSPVIANGVLYIGSADGAVYALDPANGQTKWRFQTGGGLAPATPGPQAPPHQATPADASDVLQAAAQQKEVGERRVDGTPLVEDATVLVGSGDLSFYAIDAVTGKKKWSFNAKGKIFSATLRDHTAYVVTSAGLYALDAATGQKKWLFQTLQEIPTEQTSTSGKRVSTGPVMGDGVIFLTASKGGFLYAVDPVSGKAKWVINVDGLDASAPFSAKGLVFFSVEEDLASVAQKEKSQSSEHTATLYGIEAASGQTKWKFDAPMQVSSRPMLVAGQTICFGTDKGLFALELETGRQLWRFSEDEPASLLADDQSVYVVTHKTVSGGSKNIVRALSLSTGQEKWSRAVGASPHLAKVEDGIVYLSGAPLLQAISAATGKELWSFNGAGVSSASEPLFSGGKIFLSTQASPDSKLQHGYLYAIEAKTGKASP